MCSIKKQLQHLELSFNDVIILQQILTEDYVFQLSMNKICTDHLFGNYMTEHLQLNSPVMHSVNSAENVGP